MSEITDWSSPIEETLNFNVQMTIADNNGFGTEITSSSFSYSVYRDEAFSYNEVDQTLINSNANPLDWSGIIEFRPNDDYESGDVISIGYAAASFVWTWDSGLNESQTTCNTATPDYVIP